MANHPHLTLATWLTLSRIAMVFPICWFIASGHGLTAAIALILAAITDYFDGMIARRRDEVSAIGIALDPIADKIITSCTLLACAASGLLPGIHLVAAIAIIFRETFISGLRERTNISLPVTYMAKIKTTTQFMALVLLAVTPTAIAYSALWLATGLTLWTGADYVRRWVSSAK